MNAVETDPNGAISKETIFHFKQEGSYVSASYKGGIIQQGYLVGRVRDMTFEFRYCQLHSDGELNGGHSHCSLGYSDEGMLQIIEHFQWASKPGAGRNVLQQLA